MILKLVPDNVEAPVEQMFNRAPSLKALTVILPVQPKHFLF